jgi:hypothetical protein
LLQVSETAGLALAPRLLLQSADTRPVEIKSVSYLDSQ